MVALPTTGHVIATRSERIASATVKLAEQNPAVMRALVSVGGAASYMELGTSAGAIVIALGVDRGVFAPDAQVSDFLGVTDSYLATHDDPDTAERVAARRAPEQPTGVVIPQTVAMPPPPAGRVA